MGLQDTSDALIDALLADGALLMAAMTASKV
jgi:hypothetical protein